MAPMPPGIAIFFRMSLSILSLCQWDAPDARVVPISAACTAAEATAADAPKLKRSVELVSPNPIPSEPSTS